MARVRPNFGYCPDGPTKGPVADAAIEAYEQSLRLGLALASDQELAAAKWPPLLGIGTCYLQLGKSDTGDHFLEMALQANPYHPDLRRYFLQRGLPAEAWGGVEAAIHQQLAAAGVTDRNRLVRDLAQVWMYHGLFAQAIGLWEQALAAGDTSAALLTGLANAYRRHGDEARGLALLEAHRWQPGVFEILGHHSGRPVRSSPWHSSAKTSWHVAAARRSHRPIGA